MRDAEFTRLMQRLEHGTIAERALFVALKSGQVDEAHHKAWAIDQMVRLLAGAKYDEIRRAYENGGEYHWDEGIAP